MFKDVKHIVQKAHKGGYAVAAVDAPNLEIIQAIVWAADEMKSPVIVQATESDNAYGGMNQIITLTESLAKDAKVPVGLHLDHGKNYDFVIEAIKAGYTSVMIDGSHLPYEDNMELTKRVEKFARPRGVYVQAELGSMLDTVLSKRKRKIKDKGQYLTDPMMAREFVKETGVDTLAVAIGALHGALKYQITNPRLDFRRLSEIRKAVSVPLVMHGSSEISKKSMRKIVQNGVAVCNYRTDVFAAYTKKLRSELKKNPNQHDLRKYTDKARDAATQKVKTIIGYLGSKNKA